tara:strand:+ start:249 stop:530 length:282 start_codon:yes stop_codon:yes gene_type:complete
MQTQTNKHHSTNLILEAQIKNIFKKYYISNEYFYIPLENEKTKVNNIKEFKNWLNNNVKLYELSIIFLSGIEQEYKTALKIKALEDSFLFPDY